MASFTLSMQQMAKVLTKGTVGGKQVSKHAGDKRNAMTQLLAIPKSQLQCSLDNGKTSGTRVWCPKGTTLKAIRNATP